MLTPAERRQKIKAVVRVASGNFLEMYDFIIYGYYATYIARTFFPADNEFVSLMAAFLAYGAGFLIRPIGAVVLGSYTDRVGRRAGLILSLVADGGRHGLDRVHARLRDDRHIGADHHRHGPSHPGLLRRRRDRRLLGLSRGDRHPRQSRLLHLLAIGQSAGRGHALGRARRRADLGAARPSR